MKRIDWGEVLLALAQALSLGFAMGYILQNGVSAFMQWQMWVLALPGLVLFWYNVKRRHGR